MTEPLRGGVGRLYVRMSPSRSEAVKVIFTAAVTESGEPTEEMLTTGALFCGLIITPTATMAVPP